MPAAAEPQPVRAGTLLPLRWWREPRWQLGSSARDLVTGILSWSADELADGVIPATALRMLAAAVDDPQGAIARLVEAQLLELRPDGGAVLAPELAGFNLAAAEVEAIRARRVEAGRQGGLAYSQRREPVRDPATGRLRGSRPKRSPEQPPDDAPDATSGVSTGATGARLPSTGIRLSVVRESTPRAPEGLPHLTPELDAAWEAASGRSLLASGSFAAEYLDDAAARHPEPAVLEAIRAARETFAHVPETRALAVAVRGLLDPLPGSASGGEAARASLAERRRHERAVANTKATIHANGAHAVDPDPACPVCREAAAQVVTSAAR